MSATDETGGRTTATAKRSPARPALAALGLRRSRGGRRGRGGGVELRRLAYAAPAFAFLLLFFVYPLYLMVDLSLHDVSIGTVARDDNEGVGLENYRTVLAEPDLHAAIPRTAIFLVATVLGQLALGLGVAVLLNERLPGLRLARSLVFFVWLLPPVVSGAIWRFMFSGTENGIFNWLAARLGRDGEPTSFLTENPLAMGVVTLVNTWAGVPFVAIVLLAALQSVPGELYEAARMDGASAFRRFVDVTLPTVAPTLAILAVLLTIYAFKTFDYIVVLTRGGPGTDTSTVPFLAYLRSFTQYDFGEGAAIGVLAVLASLVLAAPYLLQVRRERQA